MLLLWTSKRLSTPCTTINCYKLCKKRESKGNVLPLCRGVEGKQVGSMDEESQVRGCYNITFICTPTNQETVSVLEKTQANKTFRT